MSDIQDASDAAYADAIRKRAELVNLAMADLAKVIGDARAAGLSVKAQIGGAFVSSAMRVTVTTIERSTRL